MKMGKHLASRRFREHIYRIRHCCYKDAAPDSPATDKRPFSYTMGLKTTQVSAALLSVTAIKKPQERHSIVVTPQL